MSAMDVFFSPFFFFGKHRPSTYRQHLERSELYGTRALTMGAWNSSPALRW